MRRGEPRSRRTHRTPRGEIRTRPYPKVWVTILPTLAPAQTLQSRLLGSTVCARSAQRLQSGGVLPAPDPPGPARALLSQRKRANEWEAGAPQRGAAKTSREEQRPTAGLAPAPRRLLRSQCSRGRSAVTPERLRTRSVLIFVTFQNFVTAAAPLEHCERSSRLGAGARPVVGRCSSRDVLAAPL